MKFFLHFKTKIAIAILIGISVIIGCSTRQAQSTENVKQLRYQSYPGLVSLPELAQDLGYLGDIKLDYVGTVQGGPQDLLTLVAGDVDFAGAFNGAVVKVVAAGLDVVPIVASYGSDADQNVGFYVLENSSIRSPRDFIGKKIAVNTFGAHYDFIVKAYLSQHGLTEQEIAQVELIMLPPVSTEQALRNGQIDIAVFAGILEKRALKNGGVRSLFKDIDLYGPFTAGSYSMRRDFIEKNPEITRQFVSGVAQAQEWLHNTPKAQIIARMESIIHKRHRNETTTLIPYYTGTGVHVVGSVQRNQDFQPWIDALLKEQKIKPNQIDINQLYSNAFNPYAKNNQQGIQR
ncbi:ABC transporter substrate-binding protein [Acinetobacter gerneri]|uniref:ABC transporter substrate-binding protein n=1 Tax=Acinetobacter gerneri TaxID=202952 RepID=A0AAW8JMP7_9GAMM|nr:ABC transporter substrate-binding protein [Acinetobacter gerneri]MDQ9011479.1 ABC transporter substrate-binding protein [Acinetobacter gerneri]MDQ9015640.1 ABC transporter substrate-binding protein [Acinetobacter gerneri]MDQ9026811.1 ABC transporter substrate-binding protein [Acinetobacter gerneri]MDQ9054067.1 ABC transporter substrate-binding protein [Acinetobacter gerneri]MDQ9061762.1 ABC transporter substrate-binding protein [Acinetobacter gerneri]